MFFKQKLRFCLKNILKKGGSGSSLPESSKNEITLETARALSFPLQDFGEGNGQ